MAIDFLDSSCEANIAENFRRTNAAIEGGGGGASVLVVEYQEDEITLNKTWQEIHDALLLGQVVLHAGDFVNVVVAAYENQSNQFAVTLFGAGQPFEAIASTKDGYPEVND